jgi:hypothetical protein
MLAWGLAVRPATAQTATLVGAVRRDTLNHELPNAEVYFPTLKVGAVSNYLGEFRVLQLPAGKHPIEIRHVGYAPYRDTVNLAGGSQTVLEFIMTPQPTQLDSVRVTESAGRPISPRLRAFEERRKTGIGYYIGPDELRKDEDRAFSQLLRERIPALQIVTEMSSVWAASNRGETSPNIAAAPTRRRSTRDPTSMQMPSAKRCWVSVYLDGSRIYDRVANPDLPPTNLAQLLTNQFAAVEYYPGGASVPAEYNSTGGGCGVLLLWTRER